VSCPTEALFFAAAPPEPLLPKFNQARGRKFRYGHSLRATVLAAFSAKASTKFSEIS